MSLQLKVFHYLNKTWRVEWQYRIGIREDLTLRPFQMSHLMGWSREDKQVEVC
jgi:succinate dehydrogenase flavin-adding protein (antitoxin of CptAB toxin-antitoxin module)